MQRWEHIRVLTLHTPQTPWGERKREGKRRRKKRREENRDRERKKDFQFCSSQLHPQLWKGLCVVSVCRFLILLILSKIWVPGHRRGMNEGEESSHSLGAFPMPGNILTTFYIHLNLTILWEGSYSHCHFLGKETKCKRVTPETTHSMRSRARIRIHLYLKTMTQVICLQVFNSNLPTSVHRGFKK